MMRTILFERLTRRGFLTVGVAASGILGSGAPAASAPRYLLEWGRHGAGEGEFDAPIGIAVDSRDQVYVTDFKNRRVQKFSSDGRFLQAFPVPDQPGGIAVDPEGRIYVGHWSLHKIRVYAPGGELLREWGKQGTGDGEFRLPGGLAFGGDGALYVADQGNSRIQKFSPEGRFLAKWGELGAGPGQFGAGRGPGSRFAGPQFVAVDGDGHVYATDTQLGRVQKFTTDGRHLRTWGSNRNAPGGFGGGASPVFGPIALCVDRGGNVWVSATNHRVQQFDRAGRYLQALGGEGNGPGQFRYPHGLAVDSRACLYVVDSQNARIQKFALAG